MLNTVPPHIVVSIDAPTRNNGVVTLSLDSGEVAMFKACGVGALAETAAYHVDRLVGFFRAPAVASRAFPLGQLYRVASSSKQAVELRKRLDALAATCATPEPHYLVGSMVGWAAQSLERLDIPGW